MEKIASFTIDHERLEPGIFLSRQDRTPSGDVVSTFDIRMTRPNREAALTPQTLHAMEHLAATFLRNDAEWKDRVVYWGPMGCCTGNYLIVKGSPDPDEIRRLLIRTFEFISVYDGQVPGATPRDCGNYLLMNLPEARIVAKRYLNVLKRDDCPSVYPE